MNTENSPILSIIIPTKNRYETIIPVIEAITKYIHNSAYEIVIQDNSDDNIVLLAYLENKKDIRLSYFYTNESISITDNTDLAVTNAVGKYLIFIGDDDIVSPNILDFLDLMDKNNIDCLIYNPGYYWWSNVNFTKKTYYHTNNALWIPKNISYKLEKLNSEKEIKFMLDNGASGYFKLPRLYHGIVKKEVLEKIREKTGTYLPGSCPDIAFATALSLTIKDYYYINYPISIFGASKNSGGGWSVSNKHFGKIEDQKWLPKNILEKWDPLIPKIWSECTIYPQSVYEVLHAFKVEKKINYTAFFATMLSREAHLNKYTLPILKKYCKNDIRKYLKILILTIKKVGGKFYRNYKIRSRNLGYSVEIVSDIDHVMKVLNKINI